MPSSGFKVTGRNHQDSVVSHPVNRLSVTFRHQVGCVTRWIKTAVLLAER